MSAAQVAAVGAAWELVCGEVLAAELPGVVKAAVREVVRARLPAKGRRNAPGGRRSVLDEVMGIVVANVVHEEARATVHAALRDVAREYTLRRSADRAYDLLVSDVLRKELPKLVKEARYEAAAADVLDDALAPRLQEVAAAALRESRGAVARRREDEARSLADCGPWHPHPTANLASTLAHPYLPRVSSQERQLVASTAAECVLEPLMLDRLLQARPPPAETSTSLLRRVPPSVIAHLPLSPRRSRCSTWRPALAT